MHPPRRPFWVTVEHAPGRTQDHRIEAPDLFAAGWIFRQLHPGATVRLVRPIPSHQEA